MKPNIFKYATNELSQDALICYVVSFSSDEYKEESMKKYKNEYELSQKFLKALLDKVKYTKEIKKLEIRKQYKKIDVLLIINDKDYFIIEDKTYTGESKKQIERYIEALKKYIKTFVNVQNEEIDNKNIYAIYYKSGDESYTKIKTKEKDKKDNGIKFGTFLRKDILEIFKEYKGENIIIKDYFENLQEIQNGQDNFKNVNLKENYFTWQEIYGLFNVLDTEFKKDENFNFNWQDVNPPGGKSFMGYYFINDANEKYLYYMQLEYAGKKKEETKQLSENDENKKELHETYKLAVKIKNNSQEKFDSNKKRNIIKKINEKGINIEKSKRFGSGKHMTLGFINNYIELNANGTINVEKTAKNIKDNVMKLEKIRPELM